MAKIFVYGTLKRGFHAHSLLSSAPSSFYSEIRTSKDYHLYDVGSFPGLIFDSSIEGQGVLGELYEVPEAAFKSLDRYECVSTGLFRREIIELEDGTKCSAYIFNSNLDNSHIIDEGVWLEGDSDD